MSISNFIDKSENPLYLMNDFWKTTKDFLKEMSTRFLKYV